MDFSCFHSKL